MEGSVKSHPYVPTDLYLPDFVPGALSQSTILAVYGISSLVLVSLIWALSGNAYCFSFSVYYLVNFSREGS